MAIINFPGHELFNGKLKLSSDFFNCSYYTRESAKTVARYIIDSNTYQRYHYIQNALGGHDSTNYNVIPLDMIKEYYVSNITHQYDTQYIEFKNIEHKHLTNIEKDSSIYVAPESKLSRARIRNHFKIVRKNTRKYPVVLNKDAPTKYVIADIQIFKNEKTASVYYLNYKFEYDSTYNKTPIIFEYGKSVYDYMAQPFKKLYHIYRGILKEKGSEFFNNVMEATYQGTVKCIIVPVKGTSFIETIKDPDLKFIWDTELNALCETEDTQFSLETFKSLREELSSKDPVTIEMALRALSSISYMKYRFSVLLLMYDTYANWRYSRAKNLSSIKFMLKDYERYVGSRFIHMTDALRQETSTQTDIDCLKQILNWFKENNMLYELPIELNNLYVNNNLEKLIAKEF